MAWSHVQGVDDSLQSGSANTRAMSYGSDVTSGNLLIAVVTWIGNRTCTCSGNISGGGTLTWHSTPRIENSATNNQFMQVFYAVADASGSLTVTATFSQNCSYRALALEEFNESGGALAESDYSDDAQNAQSAPGTGTDAVTTGNITVADDGSLLYGWMMTDEGNDIGSAGTGFAFTGTTIGFGGTDFAYGEWDEVNSGTDQATWTISGADETYVAGLAFSPPSGGPTTALQDVIGCGVIPWSR